MYLATCAVVHGKFYFVVKIEEDVVFEYFVGSVNMTHKYTHIVSFKLYSFYYSISV